MSPRSPDSRAQDSLEVILLIGGSVLVALIVLVLVINTTSSGGGLISDGLADYEGSISLPGWFGSTIPVCGDGFIDTDSGEVCDDGDTESGDGCNSLCAIEDGWVCSGVPSVCMVISVPFCGDGTVEGIETCDPPEDCVPAYGSSCNYCNPICQISTEQGGFCGDNEVEGPETCDDGNTIPGDGCDESCHVESPASLCPNGFIDLGEECDGSSFPVGADSCLDHGMNGGVLGCTPDCHFNLAACLSMPNYSQLKTGAFEGILHCSGPLFQPNEHDGYLARFSQNKPSMVRFNIGLYPPPQHFTMEQTTQNYLNLINGPYAGELPYLSITYTFQKQGVVTALDVNVINGDFDSDLIQIADMVKAFNRPTFVRIASEFNGSWNNYKVEYFVDSYRYIVDFFDARGVNNAIYMWNYYPSWETAPFASWYLPWYPGDDYVDWWSMDLFTEHFENPSNKPHQNMLAFINQANIHGKPIAMPESAPDGQDLDSLTTWNNWFTPYFSMINNPTNNIKNFCYSNRNFELNDVTLTEWGNMRIDSKLVSGFDDWALTPLYENAIANPNYLSQPNP